MFLLTIEKAAFLALEADEGAYEELEDDFLFIANEGKLALEATTDVDGAKEGVSKDEGQMDMNEADYRSRDVHFLDADDTLDEEEKALQDCRLRVAALLP